MKNDFNRVQVLIAIALTLLTFTSHADALKGRVVGISDGDTLTLLDAAMPALDTHRLPISILICGM